MAKKAYIGVDGVARKIKKGYVGVDGVARKIKKAYIGIGGVARPFWSGGELAYYGQTPTATSAWFNRAAGATVGNYALIGSDGNKVMNAYSSSLVRSIPSAIRESKSYEAGASVGDYALIAGGVYGDGYYTTSNYADAYNTSLTRSNAPNLTTKTERAAGISTKNYALICGGSYYDNDGEDFGTNSRVSAYNASLTVSRAYGLSTTDLKGTTVGDYAVMGGGADEDGATNLVSALDASLTQTMPEKLSARMEYHAAATTGNYALFAGGYRGGTVVDAYDASLTRHSATPMSVERQHHVGVTIDGFAIFAGGGPSGYGGTAHKTVDVYDSSLTRTIPPAMKYTHNQATGVAVGNYALIVGGFSNENSSPGITKVVEVYTVV